MAGVKVKICGITNQRDAVTAAELGADFLGFNFFDKSPRCIAPKTAKEIIDRLYRRVKAVGVFVNENPAQINTIAKYCCLDFVQLHGTETPDFCERINQPVIKAFRVEDIGTFKQIGLFDTEYILMDAFSGQGFGGTGKQIKKEFLPLIKKVAAERKVFLSGGLTADNVHRLVREVKPFGVDVASGVEIKAGRKSAEKMRDFIAEAKK
jgi:phosphoribosylanthranilate isomerase